MSTTRLGQATWHTRCQEGSQTRERPLVLRQPGATEPVSLSNFENGFGARPRRFWGFKLYKMMWALGVQSIL